MNEMRADVLRTAWFKFNNLALHYGPPKIRNTENVNDVFVTSHKHSSNNVKALYRDCSFSLVQHLLNSKKNDMTQRLLGQGIAPNGGTTHHLCLAATGIVHHPSFLAYPIPSSLARFQSLVNTLRNSAQRC